MSTKKRAHYHDIIDANGKREERELRRISALQARIVALQNPGAVPRVLRAMFSSLHIVDSQERSLRKLTERLADADEHLAAIRLERRELEATRAGEILLYGGEFGRGQANDIKANIWSLSAGQSFSPMETNMAQTLAMNNWADRNTKDGAGA